MLYRTGIPMAIAVSFHDLWIDAFSPMERIVWFVAQRKLDRTSEAQHFDQSIRNPKR